MSISALNKPITPFFEEAHIVTDRQILWHQIRVVCGFFLSVKFAVGLNEEYILGQEKWITLKLKDLNYT